MIEIFIQSVLIGYSGAIMPGSLLTYTLDQSIKSGVKAGLMVSIGHTLLELLLLILILLGFGQYLSSDLAQMIIGLLGGFVLIYLGGGMVKDSYTGKIAINLQMETKTKSGNMLIGGAVISATNPYFTVWWAAVGLGLIMNAFNTFGLVGVIIFYLGHIISDFSWYLFISWLVSKTRSFISLNVYKVIVLFLGICLIGFGAGFLWNCSKLIIQYLS